MNTVKLNFNDDGSIDIYELNEGVESLQSVFSYVKTVKSMRSLSRELKKYDPLR